MVAENVFLPNVRRIFVPDRGHTIVDSDLSGADAQVVAWEAGDEDLKEAFKKGLKIHVHNARAMFEETKDLTDEEIKTHPTIYIRTKRGVHACNYGANANSLMVNNGWDRNFAHEFKERWFYLHPKIREWHHRYERYLQGTQCWNCDEFENITIGKACPSCGSHLGRTIKNAFGYRIIYLDRADNLLPTALAWTPQSTVAFCTEIGWTSLHRGHKFSCQIGHGDVFSANWSRYLVHPDSYEKYSKLVTFLLQNHDSTVFQVPYAYEDEVPDVVERMLVRVPYKDPLVIPLGFGMSRKSWGEID